METQTLERKETQTQILAQTPLFHTSRDLRYILTQDCNYACGFCHKERMEGNEKSLFTPQDYAFIYETARQSIPIKGVTLTGGEPLIRKDIVNIAQELKEKSAYITIVSNGALLRKKEEILPFLDRINISLHTTNQKIYEAITNTKTPVHNIMQHIALIKSKYPKIDFRINSTLVQGLQPQEEIQNMLDFVVENDLTIKYLELTPVSAPGHIPTKSLIPLLLQNGFSQTKDEKEQMVFQKNNAKVMLRKCTCELVEELKENQSYCKKNSDINIAPDGGASVCLMDTKKFGMYDRVQRRDTEGLAVVFRELTNEKTKYKCCL